MLRVDASKLNLKEKVIHINRVAKVVKGGRRFSFSALVAVGDENGYVGVGLGKANQVPDAVRKGIEDAKKNLILIPLKNTTIPYKIEARDNASKVILIPASRGTGIIAGGAVRAIMELAGVKDILSKSLGTSNVFNVARATFKCLQELKTQQQIAKLQGKIVEEKIETT